MRACLVLLSLAASGALAASVPRHHPHHPQPSSWATVFHDSDTLSSGSSSGSGSSDSGTSGGDSIIIPLPQLPPLRKIPVRSPALPATNAERLRRGLPLKAPTRVLKARQAEASAGLTEPGLTHELLAEGQVEDVWKSIHLKREELPLMPAGPKKIEGYIALSLWPDDRTVGYLACAAECAVVPPTAVSRATVFNFTAPSPAAGGEDSRFEIGFEGGIVGGKLAGADTTNIPLTPISSPVSSTTQTELFTYDVSSHTITAHWGSSELALSSSSEKGLTFTTDIEGLRDARYRKGSKGEGPLMMTFVQVAHQEW
ncbi:hypothetical protein CALCODRAFT_480217 [Calocera cornea HHB12733]|uniref:Uncharacterized protein n=1 Tax=Calocera cornea HHB12733 TaxID=1353952 RepID=A0A165IW02_9BASI|nr:hypothetical protein CALCODRAFT_480217 [Calocera cornea HHB12733]